MYAYTIPQLYYTTPYGIVYVHMLTEGMLWLNYIKAQYLHLYLHRNWRLDPKIFKNPLRIKPLLKQICKKTAFPFFEASLFFFVAMKSRWVFMGDSRRNVNKTLIRDERDPGLSHLPHLALQSSSQTWASCCPVCRTFPWGGCEHRVALLTAEKKFNLPSCDVKFLPKKMWSTWFDTAKFWRLLD